MDAMLTANSCNRSRNRSLYLICVRQSRLYACHAICQTKACATLCDMLSTSKIEFHVRYRGHSLSFCRSHITSRQTHEVGEHEGGKHTMYTCRQRIFKHVYNICLVCILCMRRVRVALDLTELLGQVLWFHVPVFPRNALPSCNALTQLVQINKRF